MAILAGAVQKAKIGVFQDHQKSPIFRTTKKGGFSGP